MARKPKIEPIASANFYVFIDYSNAPGHWASWIVHDRKTCAETERCTDFEEYYALKRVWRKSKIDFESACRFMEFGNLFSRAGVKLP